MITFDSILVPVDGSENSKRALGYAIDLARRYSAKLTIIHVVPLATAIVTGPEVLAVDVSRQLEESGKNILSSAIEVVKNAGLEACSRMVQGRPGNEIVEVAKEEGIDLIVIGRRGLGAVARFFLGSVTDHVVHNAPCPVMIVK
ncbi:MAG: universal stress protein [Candidatus Bathyarchaeia archaeon]